MSSTSPGSGPLGRVSTACARCRRQKLKCDATKPCTMCVRSGMECQPRLVPGPPIPRRRKASNAPGDDGEGTGRTARRPRTTSSGPEAAGRSASSARISPDQASPLTRQSAGSIETQQFGANRSTISLAMNMYENLGTHAPMRSSTIPGDASPSSPSGPIWELQTMQMPAPPVMEKLIDVYFSRLHWFIWIFHRPSFMNQVRDIISAPAWRREDMSKVLVTLTVAALGLKCAIQNTSPQGQQFLESVSPDPQLLMNQMIGEVRMHLLDLLDDSCIETVQVTVLLGAFYIFHGSPSLAWAMIGMSVRASYAIALHCDLDLDDQISAQVRRRCWNHVTVADTFASQIYGRPASLDPAFSNLLPLAEMDDTAIDLPPGEHGSQNGGGAVSALTFHWLKYRLYEIIRKTISTFRLLQLNSPMTAEDLKTLIDAVRRVDAQLAEWRKTLPAPLDSGDALDDESSQGLAFQELFDDDGNGAGSAHLRLKLQALLLQITYDAAIILAHRPLLEHRLSSEYRRGISKSSVDQISRSFDVSVKAALRISRTPVMQFEHEFCLAFVFVHLFTAGVILCIPPTSHPYSNTAQEAKAGAFRIIQAAKALSPRSQIARHAEQFLSDLLKLSLHHEVDVFFKDDRKANQRPAPNQLQAEPSRIPSNAHEAVASAPEGLPNLQGGRDFNNQNQYGETPLQVPSMSNSETPLSSLQQDYDTESFGDGWVEPYPVVNLVNAAGSNIQPLDLRLDEAFGAFGQVMFNLMPDDPLNNWGWGRGSI